MEEGRQGVSSRTCLATQPSRIQHGQSSDGQPLHETGQGRAKEKQKSCDGHSVSEGNSKKSSSPPTQSVTEGASGSDDHDWLDPSWLGDEPNWTELVMPGARRPKVAEDWDTHWENVWRWLYCLADTHGLNSFDRTVYAGFKKISASIGDLWLDLSKVRRLMNLAGVPLDPKGVGCQGG